MPKYYDAIGFADTVETRPGIWVNQITERYYCGETQRNSRRLQSAETLNDNLTISNEISIVSDPYADNNFHHIHYAKFMGIKWKVTNVDVRYPRLILTLGGEYNGEQA